jgi:hypothetical protein
MNKLFKSIAISVGLLFASVGAFGQASLTFTKLSAAVSSSSTTLITVSSTTGITAPSASDPTKATLLYIEDGTGGNGVGEAMFVNAVSGNVLRVTRGYDHTVANPHISGALVLVGQPNQFFEIEPSGACTSTTILVTPYVNIRTGNQWLCSSVSGSWVPGFFNTAAQPGVTTAVASVAGATNPSGPLFHITGANAITAWGSSTTVGLAGGGGAATDTEGANFCIIPDAAFTTTATNNIALASTAVINKVLCYTFDQTNKKYVPTY